MITSIYTGRYEYEKAYIYIYNAELITMTLYEEEKDTEVLSTLLAIRYLKANMAIDLGLESEADRVFEDAEKLRKENDIRKRVDCYINIATYYHKKGNYIEAEKYALDLIDISEEKRESRTNIYSAKIIIANSYLEKGESIDKVIELLKNIEENYNPSEIFAVDKYLLYSKFYDIYGMESESSEYLEKSYEILKSKHDILRCKVVLDKLINLYEKSNNEEALFKLYKEYTELNKKHEGDIDIDFILTSITNTNIIEATTSIKILKLENKQLMYLQGMLILIIIPTMFLLRKHIYLNMYDMLTQVYNRGYFDKVYRRYNKNKKIYSLIIFDIDNFKSLNDTYGHSFGDIVLTKISKQIKSIIGRECKLFRYGGEEFVILVNSQSRDYALDLAESVRAQVEAMVWKEAITVTISMGVAYSVDNTHDIITCADYNLYKSKKNGKNRVTYGPLNS